MIEFKKETQVSRLGDPRRAFSPVALLVEIRTCPLLGLRTRITPPRITGKSLREGEWPDIEPAVAASREDCPFCPGVLEKVACRLDKSRFGRPHLTRGKAFLFPNIAPYGPYSAVTVISARHYTEVGAYDPGEYLDAFLLSRDYLRLVMEKDPAVRFGAITQNHLPASGGTVVHPHLQVQADTLGPAFSESLHRRQIDKYEQLGRPFWEELAEVERGGGERYLGRLGAWDWLTMWAPQGFSEVWGAADLPATPTALTDAAAREMVDGLLRVQAWYRTRLRNSFNLAVYFSAPAHPGVRLTCRILARNNWAPFARSDRSFFEIVLGEQVTDQRPEEWAASLKPFFAQP